MRPRVFFAFLFDPFYDLKKSKILLPILEIPERKKTHSKERQTDKWSLSVPGISTVLLLRSLLWPIM